ncbi:TPA: helix-turn-helix domain-containing protein [Providencia alcalifaciens]
MNKNKLSASKYDGRDNLLSFYCGLIIRKIRKENGISAHELAKKINISQQQMSRYELGITKFSLDMLFNISVALDIPFERIIKFIILELQKSPSDDATELKNKISASDTVYFY